MHRIRNRVPEPVPGNKPPDNEAYEVMADEEDEYWGDVADILYDLRQRYISYTPQIEQTQTPNSSTKGPTIPVIHLNSVTPRPLPPLLATQPQATATQSALPVLSSQAAQSYNIEAGAAVAAAAACQTSVPAQWRLL